jgi:hypothetical protein
MPEPIVDISVFGDKALTRALGSFEPRVQKKVVRQALRASLKRNKEYVVQAWQQHADRGVTARAFAATKIRAGKRSRGRIRIEWPLPDREPLGIAPEDPHYYPNAVEYGHKGAPAKAYTRRAVNAHINEEHAEMGKAIGRGVEREAKKHFTKAVRA